MKARTFQIGKGERMYQGFEHEMARERAAQMRGGRAQPPGVPIGEGR